MDELDWDIVDSLGEAASLTDTTTFEYQTFAAYQDFDFVELNMEYSFERRRIDADHVRQITNDYGLDVVVHLPYRLDPGSPHEHVRTSACREFEAAIDTAIEFGAEKDIFHATSLAAPDTWGEENLRECIYESVRRGRGIRSRT